LVGLLVCVARQGYKAWFCSFVILCLDSTMTLAKNEKCERVVSWWEAAATSWQKNDGGTVGLMMVLWFGQKK
jgi:hypothetical protein